MEMTGRCLCGSITYTCSAEPIVTGLCHCTDCQRQTSAAASTVVGVPAGMLVISGDTLSSFATTGDVHGTKTNRFFCSACGSPIVSRIDALPDIEFIKAGTLDDRSWLQPTVEFFARSAQSWMPPIAGAERLETVPA